MGRGAVFSFGAVEVHRPGRHAEIMFMAYTGCRPGEVFGLHWSDVDIEGASDCSQGTPTADLKYSATDGKLEWVKTNESRPMPLIPKLVEVLSRHREQQLAGRAPKWHDGEGDVVFPSETKTYRLDQSLQKPFKLCSHAVGQKVTPQVVRRSMKSWGIPPPR